MRNLVKALETAGWACDRTPSTLPRQVRSRYQWVPAPIIEWIESLSACINPAQNAWFLTGADFYPRESGFRWNEWESLSLAAADSDPTWQRQIVEFWDHHFPLLQSVKDGYAFFALRSIDNGIVYGREPEFEDVELVSPTAEVFAESIVTFLATGVGSLELTTAL